MSAARLNIERVASALAVDPKTVQRWLAGRTPRPRHRWALASLLGVDDEAIWPGASASLAGRTAPPGEIVATRVATHQDEEAACESIEHPVGLRPRIERAFQQAHVAIDFAGFSGETLHGVIQEPLDKIRIGLLAPETITIRTLLPDTRRPMGLPCRVDDLADDPDFRERATNIMLRHSQAIVESIHELADLGLVKEASAQIRLYNATPLFKLYLLSDDEAFFGFYPVRQHVLTLKGEQRSIFDLMGKDAILFRYVRTEDPTSVGSQYVAQARQWFDTMWSMVSCDFAP